MTSPIEETPRGRSPGVILASLLGILLLCGGVIFWDQSRQGQAQTVNAPAGPGTTDTAPPASPPASSGSGDGFGGLK